MERLSASTNLATVEKNRAVVGGERGVTILQASFERFLRHQVRILISSIT
jgi:hypothetical protein